MLGNLAVRKAIGHQPQDLTLALAQRLGRGSAHGGGRGYGQQLQNAPRNERIDRRAAAQHAADGELHFHVVALLEDVARGSGAQRAQNRLLRTPGRHHQDAQARVVGTQLHDQIAPIAVGQLQIHQRQRHGLLRQAGARLGQCRCEQQRIRRIAQRQQHAAQTLLQQRLVLHHQHGRGQYGFRGGNESSHGMAASATGSARQAPS